MIAATLSKLAPWLKWWPLPAMAACLWLGWTVHGWKAGAEKTDGLERQLTGINVELTRLNTIALSAEAQRADIEQRHRQLQRSLSHEATKALDACPVDPHVVSALNAGRARPAATGQPAR